MHNTNTKLLRALSESQSSDAEVTRSNIILVRNAKSSGSSHIVLKTESLPSSKTNLILDEGDRSKLGEIFIQQSDLADGVFLQSVKRFGSGTPFLLLSAGDNGNEHFLIQAGGGNEVQGVSGVGDDQGSDNILLRALEGLQNSETTSRGMSTPVGSDGEPIKLPENLESLPRADHFPTQRHRWNTNEEIAALLISFDRHAEWQSKEVKIRPKSGSMLLYSRKKVRYRRDGYCWKKRKDGKTTREDHMKLKVQGTECIYGCYVHSAILPTFHRRCYWLLQNPDIVLVHYLNVPYPDDNKLAVITPSLALWADKKEWTKDELVSQLKPMFFSEDEPDLNNELEISNFKLQTAETVEAIVSQLMEKQRVARQAALVKQLECGCPDSTCADGKSCSHPMRRITSAKDMASPLSSSVGTNSRPSSSVDNNNQVSSTTGSGSMILTNNNSPRVYSRDSRNHQATGQQNNCSSSGNTPPLVLSLSQIQGGGGLLILNSSSSSSPNNTNHQNIVTPVSVANFVCNNRSVVKNESRNGHVVLKQEVMDINPSSCCHAKDTKTRSRDTKIESNENIRQSAYDGLSYRQHQAEVIMSSAPSTPKHMDTSHKDVIDNYKNQRFCNDTVVVLGTNSNGSLVTKSDGSSVINGGFFNETLDLSQEDIQRTLSANMPLCSETRNSATNNSSQSKSDVQQNITQEINPMDFIDNCDVVVSPTHVVDDDVFVNLDAFDMLGEFPDLETLDSGQGALLDVNPSTRHEKSHGEQSLNNHTMEGSAKITDYSPEWAYPEGGVKVLVTGPWHSSGPYTVLFDTFPVPTTLVQSGVLRCYCPDYEKMT